MCELCCFISQMGGNIIINKRKLTLTNKPLDDTCINTIRFLAVDAVQKAKSGHPGAPMGAATMAYVLWDRFLKHNPTNSSWINRDRFVLSAGHASAMLYALLHLTGYDLSIEDLKNFRQLHSKAAGHPEYGLTPGVETTTGPLGQGFANGVGMAMAERWLAGTYNRPGYSLIDHFTYAIVSDGDLEEGVASEAASLAGHLRLGKLIYLYDDNNISIEGDTNCTFTEDVAGRFKAYGWHVVGPVDGLNVAEVESAISAARQETERPSLVICTTVIGFGSPNKAGKCEAHGEPLGEEEVALTKKNLGWNYPEPFSVPAEVSSHFLLAKSRGNACEHEWEKVYSAYKVKFPELAQQFENVIHGTLPQGWDRNLDVLFSGQQKPIATRSASGIVMNILSDTITNMIGGSADLAPSTKTTLNNYGDFTPDNHSGRNIHFGVREHAMGSIAGGMRLHGGIIPYTATFLVFYDYMRPSVRLAALMGIQVIYIFTHDSIGLGEDGPTHQPVEHIMGLRMVPELTTIRPADATEVIEAWKVAVERSDGPTALIFSRQNLPVLDRACLGQASGLRQGAYILWEASNQPDIILMATGSEVHIAMEAGRELHRRGICTRVVSMPSWELFEKQPEEYRESILPSCITARISIEAGVTFGWQKYTGPRGLSIGVDTFGASAPGSILYEQFGITSNNIVNASLKLLNTSE